MNSYNEAQERIPSQKEKMINLLKEAGENGVTNIELSKISLRYNARISELIMSGYIIENTQVKKGVYKYVLKGFKSDVKSYLHAADEILMIVENGYKDRISSAELKNLLEEKDFTITRKANWYKNNLRKIN
jgi:hypothetical protein